MKSQNLRRLKLTEGEQSILLATIGLSIFGAGLAFMVVSQLGSSGLLMRSLSMYDFWIILSGALGTGLGFRLARDWFGHEGGRGWRQAIVGAFVTSFLASIIGGTLALPLYGTMFGPFSVLMAMIGTPLLAVFWFSMLLGAHLLVGQWRRERDTIFVPRDAATA